MTEFKLPELGENIHQGDLVRLMIAAGATVSEGQPVMELETDKAVVEVPSSVSGVVKDVRVKVGEKISVGQVIFTVDNGTASAARAPSPAKAPQAPADPPTAQRVAAPTPPPPRVSSAPAASASSEAATEFRLPELGENITQGDLVRLMVSPGATVSEGQPVMEIETDKAVVEVPSSVNGVVKDVQVSPGQKIQVGQVIFTLLHGTTSQSAHKQSVSHNQETRIAFQAAIQSEGKTEEEALPPDQPKPAPVATFSMPLDLDRAAGVDNRGPVPAAPHVRRLARELGVDIHNVPGSGPGGRISEDDVKAYTKQVLLSGAGSATPTHLQQPPLPDFSKWGKIERVSMRGVRRKTAEHMWEAWNSIPHVTQNDKADITELEQLRARFGPKGR